MIKFSFEHDTLLKQLGADPKAIYSGQEFKLEDAFKTFKPRMRLSKARPITQEHQFDDFTSLMADGFDGNPIIVIGSLPTDARAKILALNLMSSELDKRRDNLVSKSMLNQRKAPRWYSVYNRFLNFDSLQADNPSAVFIANVVPGSTSQKLEKARDLLEFFSDRPRIIITAGEDPVGFVVNSLYTSVNYGFLSGNERAIIPTLIDVVG